jgi:glutathione synthase
MSTPKTLPSPFPPLSEEHLASLHEYAADWCLSHGVVVRGTGLSALQAPITLLPSSYPRKAFDSALSIQPLFNELVHKVANNAEWLGSVAEK